MIPCSFCGKNSEYEVLVYTLRGQGTKFSPISRAGLDMQLHLCKKCLPFEKGVEVTKVKTIQERIFRPSQ